MSVYHKMYILVVIYLFEDQKNIYFTGLAAFHSRLKY